MNDRTWTATLEIDGEQIAVTPSPYNLQRDQLKTAISEAAEWVRAGYEDVFIQLWKTTKANGTVKDQHWTVYECPRTGRIKAQH